MRRVVVVPVLCTILTIVPQACQRDEATAPQLPRPSAQAMGGSTSKIAFTSTRDVGGIYVMNADGSGQTSLGVSGEDLSWSPDGRLIVFKRFVDSAFADEIYVMAADGSGETRLTTAPSYDFHPRWLRGGTW